MFAAVGPIRSEMNSSPSRIAKRSPRGRARRWGGIRSLNRGARWPVHFTGRADPERIAAHLRGTVG